LVAEEALERALDGARTLARRDRRLGGTEGNLHDGQE